MFILFVVAVANVYYAWCVCLYLVACLPVRLSARLLCVFMYDHMFLWPPTAFVGARPNFV